MNGKGSGKNGKAPTPQQAGGVKAANGAEIPPGHGHLYFDGTCRPSPGRGGAGGWLVFVNQRKRLATLPVCFPLGHSNNPIAECLGLIWGLYKARIEKVSDLVIFGDSEFVFAHVPGQQQAPDGQKTIPEDSTLKVLSHLAEMLVKKFRSVKFQKIKREHNVRADTLAVQGVHMVEGRYPEGSYTYYFPNLLTHSVCTVDGIDVIATNDFSQPSPDGFFFIDVAYLYSMHREKVDSLIPFGHVKRKYVSVLTMRGKPRSVLGMLGEPIEVTVEGEKKCVVRFVVVLDLPVPMHISTRHPELKDAKEIFEKRNTTADSVEEIVKKLPTRYQGHSFHKEDRVQVKLPTLDNLNLKDGDKKKKMPVKK
jgi:ribonuclease HI